MEKPDYKAMLAEDMRRRELRRRAEDFDPVMGRGSSGRRKRVVAPAGAVDSRARHVYVPCEMDTAAVKSDAAAWVEARCRCDFEYWCARCVTIRHKSTGALEPFILNRPQRRVAAVFEEDRRAGRPLRMILLKARQWGGSTLVQLYMAWIQVCHRRGWNSLIAAHVKDTSKLILGMYSLMAEHYPEELWHEDKPLRFLPYERSANTRRIAGRDCYVVVTSAEKPDAMRGSDIKMAHLSEMAYWPDTARRSPVALMCSVCGTIPIEPLTLVVVESTANGTGNYFYHEWHRCAGGRGDKRAVFVPWYEIGIYRARHSPDSEAGVAALWETLSDEERGLWLNPQGADGILLCLDQVAWYHAKALEMQDARALRAEYPTTAEEAFRNTGANVFDVRWTERMRRQCRAPLRMCDVDWRTGAWADSGRGLLRVWHEPCGGGAYVAAVDVGGRSAGADYSVVTVLRRPRSRGGVARVCARWRGHIDHDRLAATAIHIAAAYNYALLVVESNTLESSDSYPVLERLARDYPVLYRRRTVGTLDGTPGQRVGFHTNRNTKPLVIDTLVAAVRDGTLDEPDVAAVDELASYMRRDDGGYGAVRGRHDDILMTDALALYAMEEDGGSVADEAEATDMHRMMMRRDYI